MRAALLFALFMSALLSSPALGNPGPPEYPDLYATCPESGCLYIIDLEGSVEEIGELGPPGRFTACASMAVDRDGTAYTVNNTTGELLTIDRRTGEASVVATGVGEQDGLAINSLDVPGPEGTTIPAGTLFGSTDQLVTIDKMTGEVTVIGPIGLRIAGLTFVAGRSTPFTLFGAESGSEDRLVTISTETGMATVIGTMPDVDRIGSLAPMVFDRGQVQLFGSDAGAGIIIVIDLETAEIYGRIDLPEGYRPEGMGFAYPPMAVEPSSWGAIKIHYR